MPPDDEGERGFFRGFAQHAVSYTSACALVIAGVTLALWGAHAPSGLNLLGWLLIAAGFIWLWRVKLLSLRPQGTELELCRRRRNWLLVDVVSRFVCATLVGVVIAWKSWRRPLPDFWFLGVLGLIFLGGGGIGFWRYRREGRKLRRLQGCCEQCGYDLRGLPEPRCPECGTPFTPRAAAQ